MHDTAVLVCFFFGRSICTFGKFWSMWRESSTTNVLMFNLSHSSLYIAERFKRGLKDICDLIHTLIMNAKVVEKDEESGQQDVDAIVAFLTHLTSEKM